MKKILHLNSQLEIIGGMERYIEIFYASLSKSYIINIVKFFKGNNNTDIPNNELFSFDETYKSCFILRIGLLFTRSKKIAKLCNKENIDFSISHGDVSNLFNIMSKLFFNKSKIIIIVHNAIDKKTIGIVNYILIKLFYRFSDKIISVSKELEQDIKKITGIPQKKLITIYNPFDFEKINKLKKEEIRTESIKKLLNNGKVNICNVARLATYKKQDLIIKSFFEYYKENNNIQLFFIGDGDENYKKQLIALVKKLGLENAIFFLGYKTNVYKYINKMHYYYYYSGLQEGFGRGLVDALSLGVPILTHDYKYGAKEIIRNELDLSLCEDIEIHENGILTPYMDKEKYIEAMDLLINTKFDKNKIIENTKKYDIEIFKKSWTFILK